MQSPQLKSEHMKCCFVPNLLFENMTEAPASREKQSAAQARKCPKSTRNSLFRKILAVSPLSGRFCKEIPANSMILKIEGGMGVGVRRSPRLANVVDDQNHSRPQNRDVAVVLLEGRHGGVVGTGNRVERLARLHFVMKNARSGRGGLSLRVAGRSCWMLCRRDRLFSR